MDRCTTDQMPYELEGMTGETPGNVCWQVSNMYGPADTVRFDTDLGVCFVKWPNGDAITGPINQVCAASPIDFDALGITSEQMTFVFSWGVAAVLGLWALGYIIACGVQAINKA